MSAEADNQQIISFFASGGNPVVLTCTFLDGMTLQIEYNLSEFNTVCAGFASILNWLRWDVMAAG